MPEESRELLAKAVTELRRLKAENAALKAQASEPIAVVGMACRFPGECGDPESLWQFLAAGRSAIRPTPADRADGVTGGYGSFLDDIDLFDAAFFGISPKEAQSLDPQQRLILELAWRAFESANIKPDTIAGRDVGVFVGMSGIDYALKLFAPGNRSRIDPYFGTGTTLSPAAGRLSYFLKINGPAMVVDTACSSSLVAIHLAVESLRRGECEAALAVGVNRILSPDLTINFEASGLLSPDGRCYTFDARAQGYARGEGGGVLLLKRLRDAEQAGDRVQAVILGSAVNQDGGSGGLTVPNGPAQQKVIRRALERAQVSAAEVDYVETHGTATPLGDPIEVHALGEVFRTAREAARPLAIGSIKTNFGHLEAAAGMASVFKVIVALQHEAIPPHLNFSQPSPKIDWASFPLRVVEALQPWPRSARRRVAGVSGFGFAGTNAHLILAEPPVAPPQEAADPVGGQRAELLVLSAKTPEALRGQAANYAERFGQLAAGGLAAAAHTAQTGRAAFAERLSVVASSADEAAAALLGYVKHGKARGLATGRARESVRTAFVFTGQGAQYAGMGRGLYAVQPLFRDIVDTCAARLQPLLGRDLREILFAAAPAPAVDESAARSVLDRTRNTEALAEIDETIFTQAGIFVVEYALARLWESWGVRPDVTLGHSVGEYAAACVAGVFDLDDALKLVAARGRLMQEHSAPGAMLTVFADESAVADIVAPFATTSAIAAVNGPGIVLVSGAENTIRVLQERFEQAGHRVTRTRITRAFHSPMTEPVLQPLGAVAATLTLRRPTVPLISNVTGGLVSDEVTRPEYWMRHLRERVRFGDSMTFLHARKLDFLLEIGPEPTLQGLDLCFRMIREQSASAAKWLPSLRRGHDDLRTMLDSAGRLWAAGVAIDWTAGQAGRSCSRISLPLYPYQRKRHWIDLPESQPPVAMPSSSAAAAATAAPTGPSARLASADEILAEVQAIISEVSGLETADLGRDANLLEMGLDSLMFVRAGRAIERRFEVSIAMQRFYDELHRIGPLVDFLAANAKAAPKSPEVPPEVPWPRATETATPTTEMDPVMRAHFELMERYLAMKAQAGTNAASAAPAPAHPSRTAESQLDRGMAVNFAGLNLEEEKNLSAQQKTFLAALAERLSGRTRRSKEQTQAWRRELADWKGSLQFKRSLKELKYPIVCNRAEGARLWDLDGNEYIDLALGMGVHFLGHGPAFIKEALHRQVDRTAALGPQSDLAGEVARKICQLTGAERVSLAVTGSAAVMLAQRLARAATGRPLIAQFAGAYHGIGSEVLVVGGEAGTRPLSPGIPRTVVANAAVLDYGSEDALEWIRAHASELAAVMVEPVQSRRPGFQPHRFLRRLRQLTQELEIALIFDEMINGFRIHAGGAQAWFGIQADIVTYGKIVGGGLPLSAIAGKARFLDWIDGGFWQYGDASAPSGRTIFTGGTHNRHPLALAAANAALDHMIAHGPALHETVNRRTERLGKELNAFFEAENVSLRAAWFGSQFRFEALGDPFELEVLFYLLTEQGFYTWEQRICCLSIAHTDEDVDTLIAAVRRAVGQMRAGGFAIQSGPAAVRRVLPLSPVQERLYALGQREGAEMPYHLSGIWEVRGSVDRFKLQDAFQETIRRHESLRTAFGLISGQPRQYVVDEPRFFLEAIDAAGQTPEAVLAAFIRPFDLERPPLIRVGLASLGPDRAWLLIDVHHIAADGLSMNVLLHEFAALYDGARLAPVKRQYRHALIEMEQRRQSAVYQAQEAYWREQLAGDLPVLELPVDRPRSGGMDFRGDKCLVRIDAARTRRLEALARKHGASLTMVLMAGFATLLHRLTEAEDMIIGLPVAGRPGTESDEVVGMFVNSLPLRFRPRAELSFSAFLDQVRGTCLGAYDHADYLFSDLVARLRLPPNPDRNPLFDVMFAYESAEDRAIRTRDLELRSIDQFEGSGMFDFNVDVIREAGALHVRFHYATRLFQRETIERWCGWFSQLIDALLAQPAELIGRLPLLTAAERALVTGQFNAGSSVQPAATLLTLWDRVVRAQPSAVAMVCGNSRLSYAEVDRLAGAVAGALVGRNGVRPDDRVALLLESSEWMVVAILGVMKAGAAYVPIDPANPIDRLRALLTDSEAQVLIADEPPSVPDWPGKVVTVAELLAAQADAPAVPVTGHTLAYVIYTSGSTGQPKGVLIEHGGIANSVQWRAQACGFSSADVTLQMPSYAFDASLLDLFSVLSVGGRLVLASAAEKRDLAAQAGRITREGVTNLLLTPSLHALYLQEISAAMQRLRFVTVAGEATPASLVRKHFERLPGVRLFNEYGPTENSVVTTYAELSAADETITIGRPVAGNHVFVLQPNGELCGIGVEGELVVSGPGLARGYLNRPEITRAAFTAAPWDSARRIYRTGDRARWRPDGTLEYLGRRDGQVKLRGYRIELEEIEEVLRRQPDIAGAAATIAPIGGEPQLIAYVSARNGYDEERLRVAFRRALPAYLMPSAFVRLESLPLNANGKVDRRALPPPDKLPLAGEGEPPRGPRETLLAETWTEVLRPPRIGRNDDYFQLGGDSIKGIQIISRLLQRGWRLDMRWLFRHPTIATLAPQLEPIRPAPAAPLAIAADAEAPLAAIQSWFFRVFGAQPNQFNQAIWLHARRWNVPALERALRDTVAAHEAFRFKYERSGDGWRQRRAHTETALVSRVLDLRGSADADRQCAEMVRAEQAALNIERGPLSRAVIVRLDGGDRLFWTAHHLVVDAVSWRILLEDLARAYAAADAGQPWRPPAPTAGYGQWTRAVRTAVRDGLLAGEIEHWRAVVSRPWPSLPSDNGAGPGTAADRAVLTAELAGLVGTRLQGEAHAAFRTRGIELLVAALRVAYAQWNPGSDFAVLLEGHGRECALANLDVSRTVGWFTSVYPVRFDAAPASLGMLIRETKETLRRVPRQGAGFGWLREFGDDAALRAAPLPEISFNFLGDLGGDSAGDFSPAEDRSGHAQDSRQPLALPVALAGHAAGGTLHWTLEYDARRFPEPAMRRWLQLFIDALGQVAAQTERVAAGVPSPVDFACSALTLEAFDRMVERREWLPQAIEEIFPLSPMQQGLYYETLKAPQADAYFEQMAFQLEGDVAVEALARSWQDLGARHPALRSVFVQPEREVEPLQVVFRQRELPVGRTDLSTRPVAEQRAAIAEFKARDRETPFVLAEGPLMRVHLFVLGGGRVQVVWSHHHILMDGWCIGILYEELMQCYAARCAAKTPDLEAAPDYRNYLGWLQTRDAAAAERFWHAQLDGYDSLATVPRARPAAAGEPRWCKATFLLQGEAWNALQAVAAASGATTATLLQTLWGVLLARYNGTRDVVFGAIVSGRPEEVPGVEKMIGLFINAVPVRLRFDAGITFREMLRRGQADALERRAHEVAPLTEIKQQAPALRELFDHLVVLENYPMDEELRHGRGGNAVARPRISEIDCFERTHFDFTLVASPRERGLQVELTYNESAHSAEQMGRIETHLTRLVEQLAREPDADCQDVDWLPEAERHQLEAWNATAAAYPMEATIVSLFDEQVARHAERVAVTSGDHHCTYGELGRASRELAARLVAAGGCSGERVALWLPRDHGMIVALLAVLRAGGCYVPLDPEYPEERLRFILADSGARVVVAHSAHRSPFTDLPEVLVDAPEANDRASQLPAAKPSDAAYLIYTSGSTGKPKGCLVSHRNVVRLLRNDRFGFEFGPEDVWVVAHSFCFDFSVWEMYGALLNGGRVVVAPRHEVRDTRAFVDLVSRERVTVLNQTPAAFYAFIEEARKRAHPFPAHLRYVIFGGDRLEPRYLAPWVDRFGADRPALINMYGITETTVHVTFHRVTAGEVQAADGRSVIGRPLPETTVWVLDELLRPLPIGVAGELYVGGTGVGLGYLNRPDLTAERFLPDPHRPGARLYRTGDVGRWREDGQLEYLGRNDHQVQVRGFRVELGEVEAACLRQPGVTQAVVLPIELTPGQTELVAYLVGTPRTGSELRGALGGCLPPYMIPGYVEWLPAIPLSANGKVDRKALPRPGATAGKGVAPRNAVEASLLALWSDVLGATGIGIHDNFFDLGGQSLKAVRLRARIEDTFQVTIALRELFSHPTIAELAEVIGRATNGSAPPSEAELVELVETLSPEEIEAQLRQLEP